MNPVSQVDVGAFTLELLRQESLRSQVAAPAYACCNTFSQARPVIPNTTDVTVKSWDAVQVSRPAVRQVSLPLLVICITLPGAGGRWAVEKVGRNPKCSVPPAVETKDTSWGPHRTASEQV